MKVLVLSYSFNKTAKTVTFTAYTSITLERILLVTNVTTQTIIYNFANPAKGGTVATNVLTLEYDTTSMADADKLQIFYDDPQYAVDSVASAANEGIPPLFIRDDVLTVLTPIDGDFVNGRVDQYGARWNSLATGLNKTDDIVTSHPKSRNLSVISKVTAVTIGGGAAGDTILTGLIIITAITGTCVITGFADSDGTAQTITLPAATPAGFKDFGNALNSAGALTITCSNVLDDNLVLVLWFAV